MKTTTRYMQSHGLVYLHCYLKNFLTKMTAKEYYKKKCSAEPNIVI